MDTEVHTIVTNNAGNLCPEMEVQKSGESLEDIEVKVTEVLNLSDSGGNKSADERQNPFAIFVGATKKRWKRKQPTNPSWRRSGRRWQPTSIFMRDRTPPRRRPPSSTDTDSCERPAVRGRSRVRRPPKSPKHRALTLTALKALLLLEGDFKEAPMSGDRDVLNADTDSCKYPAVRGRSLVRRPPKSPKRRELTPAALKTSLLLDGDVKEEDLKFEDHQN